MISIWAVELYLNKLNTLEDSATNSNDAIVQNNVKSEVEVIRSEFQAFVVKHKVVPFDLRANGRKNWIVRQPMI